MEPSERRYTQVTEASVRAALDTVLDPCSVVAGAPAGLDTMGLVREVTVTERPSGAHVEAVIGVTEPSCLMGVTFLRDCRAVLEAMPGVDDFHVRFDHQLRWDESMMKPSYRVELRATRQRA
jgi:metal-sulfur cluster biosynthetic enzyme